MEIEKEYVYASLLRLSNRSPKSKGYAPSDARQASFLIRPVQCLVCVALGPK
jgi:hypothetical protein